MAEINSLSLGQRDSEINSLPAILAKAVAYYRFESGALTTDSSGNGNTLTNINSVSEGTGKYGGGLDVDGSTKYMEMPSAVVGSGAHTICFCIKPDNLASNAYVLTDYDSGSSTGLGIIIDSSERIGVGVNGGTNTLQSPTLPTSEFSHVGIVINGSNSRLYINGKVVAKGTLASMSNNGNKLRINGRWTAPDSGTAISGTFELDDLAIFDEALTEAEIVSICDQTLEAYYRFESGALTIDSSGKGNTLTNVNTVAEGALKYGGAADFEASSNQYFYAADDNSLDIIHGVTLSALIKPESVGSNQALIAKGRQDNGNNINYGISIQDDTVRFYYYNGSYHIFKTTNTLSAGTEYHIGVSFTFGTPSSLIVLVNGVEWTGSWVSGDGTAAAVTNNERLQIGVVRSTTTPVEYYDGLGDDFAIFSRPLTEGELLTLYKDLAGGAFLYNFL